MGQNALTNLKILNCRGFSAYANFITANYITAIFQKKSINLRYAQYLCESYFISAIFGLFLANANFANANFFQKQKSR